MRLLTLFLPTFALFTLFPALVSSVHPHAIAQRRDHAHSPAASIITSRQYRIPRDLLDVCINVNANLLADASQLLGLSSLLGALNLGTDIQLCLCLKDLELYLDTNDQLSVLIGLLGKDTVGALITALINTSPDAKQCTFPQHAHHTCNTSDPCHYDCDPPYVRNGDQCVCAPPNVSCNGVCGEFPQGCSSAVPRSLAKKSQLITSLAQAQASCTSGESVCGIPGKEGTLSFECIDTSSTKDSCGGCMTPHPFFEVEPIRVSSGKDCTNIANTKSTTCSASRCVVNSCRDGWVPSPQKDACVPNSVESRMRRVRKRSEADTVVDTSINTDIGSLITAVVKAVISLNIHGPVTVLTSIPTSYSTNDLAHLDNIYSLVNGVDAATSGLVTSTSVPTAISYANTLLDVSTLLRTTLNDCQCVSNLGLQDLVSDVDDVVNNVGSLLTLCHGSLASPSVGSSGSSPFPALGVPGISSSSSSSPPSSGVSGDPLIVGLTTLLSSLGITGKSGATVDGLVGSGTAESVNNLLDGLNLGPANYKRQAIPPITALVNATTGGDSGLLSHLTVVVNLVITLTGSTPGSSSTTTTSPSTNSPIGSVGSSSVLSDCLIDPVVFGSLYQYAINLVESPDFDSLCRNTATLYAAERSLRDLFEACPYVNSLGLDGLLADLLLVLKETLYLDEWCVANIGAGTLGTVGSGASAHFSAGSVTSTTTVPSSAPTSVTGAIVSASVGVLASSAGVATSAALSSTVSHITTVASTAAPVPTSSTTVSFTRSTTPTVSSTTAIINPPFSYATPAASAAATDIPIIVSLDDVLSGLELGGTKAVVTVDGVLGNGLDQSVDQLLDGLNIGPHNVRRSQVRRQIVANVNATVDLGGLGGLIDGLVDLVLGLNVVGSVLPPTATSVTSTTSTTPETVPANPVPVLGLPLPIPPLADTTSSLVDQALVSNVVEAALSLLSLNSPTYGQFLHALDDLVSASSNAAGILNGCSYVQVLEGYEVVYRYFVDISQAAEALEDFCTERGNGSAVSSETSVVTPSPTVGASHLAPPIASPSSVSTPAASSSSSVDDPIVIGLTKLLKGLGLDIPAKVVVDGLLSNSLNDGVNNILNGLGIGPNGARRSEQDW